MAPTAAMVNDLLDTLNTEDYNAAISYIRFLADSRKKKVQEESLSALTEIQLMKSAERESS